jgi:hypothetical protein
MKFESVGITVGCDAENVDVLAEFWAPTLGYAKPDAHQANRSLNTSRWGAAGRVR